MPQVSVVWWVTSTTLAAVADIAIVPVASGVGSGVVPPRPCASWTRYQRPGWMVPDRFVRSQVVPPDEPYCTLQVEMSTGVSPRLYSSMKSLVRVAPDVAAAAVHLADDDVGRHRGGRSTGKRGTQAGDKQS